MLSRVLILAGAAATVLSAFLTWVTITGLGVVLDLGPIGAQLGLADGTVAGTDTSLWPAIVAVGALAGVLGLLGVGRSVLIVLGIATTLAGAALVYYMANVIDLETSGASDLEQLAADAVLDSSVGPGTPLLLAGGVLILVGALARR
jgi:hypothetical protein